MDTIETDTKHTAQAYGVGRIEIRTIKENHAMMRKDLPLGFMAVLAQDKRAMQSFAKMGDREQESVLSRARQARSRADMQLVVSSLAEEWNATEGY